jgi:hypothetical protein
MFLLVGLPEQAQTACQRPRTLASIDVRTNGMVIAVIAFFDW